MRSCILRDTQDCVRPRAVIMSKQLRFAEHRFLINKKHRKLHNTEKFPWIVDKKKCKAESIVDAYIRAIQNELDAR